MRTINLIIFLFLCPITLLAQQNIGIESIKNNPKYYWGEGRGITLDEADDNALGRLSNQISTTIEKEVSYSSNSNYEVKNISRSVTLCLQNIEKIVLKDEPDAHVFRYVAKSDVKKMFDSRTIKIENLIKQGQNAEKYLRIDDALRNYYWALMLSKAMPSPIYAEFEGEKEPQNCLLYLPYKINAVLSQIKATFDHSYSENNRIYTTLNFKYNEQDVSSVQIHYFDGTSYVGPLTARDGMAQLELQSLPSDNKLSIRYEYAFRNEAKILDDEFKAIFDIFSPNVINANITIPVKVDKKENNLRADRKTDKGISIEVADSIKDEVTAIPIAKSNNVARIDLTELSATDAYLNALRDIEQAIKTSDAAIAYRHFEPAAYGLLDTLINHTGKVRLAEKKQEYVFIQNGNQVIARHCKVSIKYKNGKILSENLIFRFNTQTGLIESLAFALTKKAEDDIFSAQKQWPEISRFAVLQFMEDYQTAYALKRLGYINQIYSEDALIVSGVMLKKADITDYEGRNTIITPYVNYKKENKKQYMQRLEQHFKTRDYINLTFEDNRTKAIKNRYIKDGQAFAIEIKQLYKSPVYSDTGYLTLLLDMRKTPALIHVRLWQPDKASVDLEEFISNINF